MGMTTNTPEALIQTRLQCFNRANGDRSDADNLAIIVTDGVPFPESRRQPAIEEAKRLRDTGVVMVSVGITDVIDEAFLREMSSSPQTLGQNYFTASDFGALSTIRRTVVQQTCERIESKYNNVTFSDSRDRHCQNSSDLISGQQRSNNPLRLNILLPIEFFSTYKGIAVWAPRMRS